MPTAIELERQRLLQGTDEEDPQVSPVGPTAIEQERSRLLAGASPIQLERQRLSGESEGPGFFDTLRILNKFANKGPALGREEFEDPARQATSQALRAGVVEGALLSTGEALTQIPGLLGFEFADKAVDWFQRKQVELHSKAEEAGLAAGITEDEVTALYNTGDFIGFIAPVTASFKAASLLLRAPLSVTGLGRVSQTIPTLSEHVLTGNLVTDMTAGAIFGGVFRPAETWEDRAKHLASESAAFGVMRIGINALAQPFIGFRNNRVSALEREADVEGILKAFRDGKDVVVETPEQALSLSKLLSEESYVTNSAAAQDIMARFQDEGVLVQGIIDASQAGQTSGVVRGFEGGFQEIGGSITRLQTQFPHLKFDVVRHKGELNVFFGSKNLSNNAKVQLKKEGRIAGQAIEKNGVRYEYVRMNKSGDLIVKTDAGKTTKLKDENITDLFSVTEAIPSSGPVETLYQDFASKLESGIDGINVGGVVPEKEIIRQIREGSRTLRDEARRPFDVGGAVIYPEELGITGASVKLNTPVAPPLPPDAPAIITAFSVLDSQGKPIISTASAVMRPGNHIEINIPGSQTNVKPSDIRQAGRQLIEAFEAQGHKVDNVGGFRAGGARRVDNQRLSGLDVDQTFTIPRDWFFRGLDTAADATEAILRGTDDVFLLEPPTTISFESLVEQWMKNSDIPLDAPDSQALRAYFGQRVREDFWKALPEAELKILDDLRAAQHSMVEAGEIPFSAYAHNKGFSVEPGDGGTVILRDLLTGRRISFGTEKVALDALNGTIRPEGDILGGSLLPVGTHGIGGFTGGFRPSDGVFTFDGKVPTREFIEDLPLTAFMQNNRDMFMRIESQTGIPLFSKIFGELDTGLTAQRNFIEPWAKKIQSVWKGIKTTDKIQVAEFWRTIEGKGLTPAQEITAAKGAGLTTRQIKAFRESRDLFDVWGRMAGLKERNQWIEGYYARVRPYAESTGGHVNLQEVFGDEASVPPEFRFFAEQHRVGDMSMVEMDPEVVMHKYIRSLGFKLHTEGTYNEARLLVAEASTPKIGDLPQTQAADLLRQARVADPSVGLHTPILPNPVRKVLSEYLNTVRGNPITSEGTMRRWGRNFFKKLGIRTDERVLEQYVNNGLSMMYGSAMGLKPALWARNATQTIWMDYTRMGAEHGGSSLKQAMTMEGWQEVVDVGVIRNVEAGLPAADAMFASMAEANAIKATHRNPVSIAIASAMRSGLRLGNVGSKTARKFLIPYSEQDALNRAWSYFWTKQFTAKQLDRFEAGKVDWDGFTKDGLPFFHKVIREEFASRYNAFGREDALRWIGKQGADEAQFIYGVGAQPAWMQKPLGRFVGMFGTWPMWAIETYFRRTKNATPAQTAALYGRTLALTGAFANMGIQTGIDMWGWVAPASVMGWSGGPAVDYVIQAKRAYEAPIDQKADALKTLANDIGRMAVPGQGFVRDLRRNLNATNLPEGALQMLLGRPVDDYNYTMEFLYDPRFHEGYDLTPPAQEGIRALRGLEDFPSLPIHQLTSPVSR